jgi:hypothetical protein
MLAVWLVLSCWPLYQVRATDKQLLLDVLQIREKEADIDVLITPIEDMYSLLLRYEVSDHARLYRSP